MGLRALRGAVRRAETSQALCPPAPRGLKLRAVISVFLISHALDRTIFRIVSISPYHGPRETLSDTSFGILLLGSDTVTQVSPFVYLTVGELIRMQPLVIDGAEKFTILYRFSGNIT